MTGKKLIGRVIKFNQGEYSTIIGFDRKTGYKCDSHVRTVNLFREEFELVERKMAKWYKKHIAERGY